MYIVKNALKSIVRSKGRNILVSIIVIMIAVASCVALAINNSAAEIVKNQEETSEVTATLNLDTRSMMQKMQSEGGLVRITADSMPVLTIDEINKYGSSEYVKTYSYSLTGTVNSTDIDAYTTESEDETDDTSNQDTNQNMNPDINRPSGGMTMRIASGDFSIVGYSDTSAMTDFLNGTNKITEGSMVEDGSTANECVISEELALFNNLSVGDTITLTNPSNEDEEYAFTIKGIYQTEASGDLQNQSMFRMSTAVDPANKIITSYAAYNNMIAASEETVAGINEAAEAAAEEGETIDTIRAISGQLSTSFVLTSVDDVENFKEDLTAKGLNEYYTVNSNADSIEESLTSINNLSSFSTTFLIIVVIVGGLILVVINMINIRERKYEVGVLTAIGMKKGKVGLQFVTELFIVTFIALTVGSCVGAVLSKPTADTMLKSQITSLENKQSQQEDNFGGIDINGGNRIMGGGGGGGTRMPSTTSGFFGVNQNEPANYIDEINAIINGKVLLEMFGIGLLLTLISSGVAIVFISRYSPLKILSERA